MKKILMLVILFAFSVPVMAGAPGESEYLRSGGGFFAAGDYENAARSYERAARLYPSSAEARKGLGESYLKLGSNEVMTNVELLEKAVRAFQAALNLDPGMKDVHFELGKTYLALQDRDGALREQRVLQSLDPVMAAELSEAIAAWRPQPSYRETGSSVEPDSGATRVTIMKNVVLVPVTLVIGFRSVRVLLALDTGASMTTISSEVASRLDIHLDQAPTGKFQVAGGGLITARAVRLDKVEAGPNSRSNMIVAVIDHNGPAVEFDGLLGMDFLRDLRYHVDFRNRVIEWGR